MQPNLVKLDEIAPNNFREYFRIPSVHPNVNYGEYFSKIIYMHNKLNIKFSGVAINFLFSISVHILK